MKRYHVQSGSLDWHGKACGPVAAIYVALATNVPGSLGLIVSVVPVRKEPNPEAYTYVQTERVLRDLGLWGGDE